MSLDKRSAIIDEARDMSIQSFQSKGMPNHAADVAVIVCL